jgi:hypothetical protein
MTFLSLCFAGGDGFSAGRQMFDAEGNLWSGQNWMADSQPGVNESIGGVTLKRLDLSTGSYDLSFVEARH